MEWVVVSKLGHKNSSELVNLKPISSFLKIKLQKLINMFYLIICFWVKDNWKFDINIHVKTYLFSEVADKLKAIIWYNKIRSTVFLIKFHESDAVYTDSINFLHKYECGVFWEAVHNNHHIDANLPIGINE